MTCPDHPVDDGLGAALCAVEAVVAGTDPHHPEVRPMGTDITPPDDPRVDVLARAMLSSARDPSSEDRRADARDTLARLDEVAAAGTDHAAVAGIVLRDHTLSELGLNDGTSIERRHFVGVTDTGLRVGTAVTGRFHAASHPIPMSALNADLDDLTRPGVFDRLLVADGSPLLWPVSPEVYEAYLEDDDPPVGPTVTDPTTGERSEFDPFDVDHDAQAEADALAGAAEADAADEAEQAHAAGVTG